MYVFIIEDLLSGTSKRRLQPKSISHAYFTGEDTNWVFRAFRYGKDSAEIAGRVG